MPNSAANALSLITARDRATVDGAAPTVAASGVMPGLGVARDLHGVWSRLSDRQLAWLIGAVLFVVCAWPLAFVAVPPLQDLPNHLSAVAVIEHPDRYPEFVFNGFFKTNAALFAWLFVVAKIASLNTAARLFALVVLAGNAFTLPRFVLAFTRSRKRMLVASLFMWPMIHNWFVTAGMLNFSLAVPLSLELLMALDRQRKVPTWRNGVLITALGVVTWYAHAFPLLVVHMLVAIEAALRPTWKERIADARKMIVPLVPVTLLVMASLFLHLRDTAGPMTAFVDIKRSLPAWELAYNMWAEWLWAYSMNEVSSLVPCLLLAAIGIWRRKESPPFFSPLTLLALLLLYCFVPYTETNWSHMNSRFIAYLWFAMLLRVPDAIPKKLAGLLGISAALYSAGLGADYMYLERERQEFIAGTSAVPEGARLLPLIFKHKEPGFNNARPIMHASGYYVVEKLTAAPLLFAHSHSFPVMYSEPPPVRFNHWVLEGFAPSMAHSSGVCRSPLNNAVVVDCESIYDEAWREFWADAISRYDYLLVWDITPEARAHIPPVYKPVFDQGRLQIYARPPLSI
ncbi:MAG: hypothetical protein FWD73_11035 [Polyangiaceae bacterium]|nr:hypothetical protein [Polyangiaceae bacterium]